LSYLETLWSCRDVATPRHLTQNLIQAVILAGTSGICYQTCAAKNSRTDGWGQLSIQQGPRGMMPTNQMLMSLLVCTVDLAATPQRSSTWTPVCSTATPACSPLQTTPQRWWGH